MVDRREARSGRCSHSGDQVQAGDVDRHLAFVTLPAHGHVNPVLPVVAELARRGWRISVATGERFRPEVEKAGATLVPTPAQAPVAPPPAPAGPAVIAYFLERVLADARSALPVVSEHFRADPPRAVCYDATSLAGRILAAQTRAVDVALCHVRDQRALLAIRAFVFVRPLCRTATGGARRRPRAGRPGRSAWRRTAAGRRPGCPGIAEHRLHPPRVPAGGEHLRRPVPVRRPLPGGPRGRHRLGAAGRAGAVRLPRHRVQRPARVLPGLPGGIRGPGAGHDGGGTVRPGGRPGHDSRQRRRPTLVPAAGRAASRRGLRLPCRNGLDDGGAVLRRTARVRAADASSRRPTPVGSRSSVWACVSTPSTSSPTTCAPPSTP